MARAEGRLAVVTTVMGEGHDLPEVQAYDDVDHLCFTDRDGLDPHGWNVIRVRPLLPDDLARSSRDPKIRLHRWLPDHTVSLHVDPTVQVHGDPWRLFDLLVGDDPEVWFGAMLHSYRATVRDEFDAVRDAGFDAGARLDEHARALLRTEPESLDARPVWGGVLARRHHDPRCVDAMEDWWAQVLRYSRRDQLSLPGVLRRHGPDGVRLVEHDNKDGELHTWPVRERPRPRSYAASAATEVLAAAERAEREAAARAEAEAALAAATTELREVRRERDRLDKQLRAVHASRSWRWTRPLRRG